MLNSFIDIIAFVAIGFCCTSICAQTSCRVNDNAGKALSNIVVETRPANGDVPVLQNKTGLSAIIEQNNQQFAPHISVVSLNTDIKHKTSLRIFANNRAVFIALQDELLFSLTSDDSVEAVDA